MKWSIFIKDAKNHKWWFSGCDAIDRITPSWTGVEGWADKFDTVDETIQKAEEVNKEGGYWIFVAACQDYRDDPMHYVKLLANNNILEIEL